MKTIGQTLKDELRDRQKRNPHFSLRSFAQWLEVSPAQLSQVINGKRAVTLKMAKKVARKLSFSPEEERELIENHLIGAQSPSQLTSRRQLKEDQFRLISDWYHFAILSLTHIKGAKADPRWIARRLGISIQQASEACERLIRVNLLTLPPYFKQVGDPLEVLTENPSVAIQKFHKQILLLAADKMETTKLKDREVQTLTFAADKTKMEKAKNMISRSLDQISKTLEVKKGDEVYALSIQLFPLSKEKK